MAVKGNIYHHMYLLCTIASLFMLHLLCVPGLLSKVERKINKAQDEIVRHLHLRDNSRTHLV